MEQKKIPILGLASYRGSGAGRDGDCLDALNVHVVDGVVKPSCMPRILNLIQGSADFPNIDVRCFTKFYYHNKADCFIAVYEDEYHTARCMMFGNDFKNITPVEREGPHASEIPWIPTTSSILSINFVGYIMIVTYADGMHYWIHQNGMYHYLGTRPPMPMLRINVQHKVFAHNHTITRNNDPNSEAYYKYAAKGFFDACIRSGNKEGYYIDRTLVRYALRMADGSYIMHSGLFLIEDDYKPLPSSSGGFLFDGSNMDYGSGGAADNKVAAKMFKLNYSLEDFGGLDLWRDLIVAVDVFTTKSIRSEITKAGTTSKREVNANTPLDWIQDQNGIAGKVEFYQRDEDFREKLLAESSFYRVASFDLNGKMIQETVLKDVSDENLAVQDRLKDDSFSHSSFVSDSVFVYNGRLHLGGCRQKLFDGYDSRQFIEYGYLDADYSTGEHGLVPKPEDATEIHFFVLLQTEVGERVVHRYESAGFIPRARLLTYPDIRACRMTIQYKNKDTGRFYQLVYPLTAHSKLNLSYFLNPNVDYKPSEDSRPTVKNSISIHSGISETEISAGVFGRIEERNEINRPNIVKVSKVDNPFFFPPENTYQVSNGSIIGLSTVVREMSVGRIGAFPLYVFTTEGIYTMEVDTSGRLAYIRSNIVSEYLCTSRESITPVLGGVAFTSQQGVMIISGNEVKNLTERIRFGRNIKMLPSLPDNALVPYDALLDQIYKIKNLRAPDLSVQDYIRNPVNVAYLYRNNELIISDPTQDYSYLCCLSSGFWYRINRSFTLFIQAFPEVYGLDKNHVYEIDRINDNEENDFIIISAPMTVDSMSHKKVMQSVLRCDVRTRDVIAFYILGSNDGQKFYLIAPKELVHVTEKGKLDTHQVDLITRSLRSNSFKFIAFAITGNAYTDSIFNHVGMLVEPSFTNKLR